MSTDLLITEALAIDFGGLRAVDNVALRIGAQEVVGLIGPNGAGKTTCFNMITGVYKPTAGTIRLAGERIDGLPTARINQLGVARTFQNIRLFREMSVLDNVRVALHRSAHCGLLNTLFRSPRYRRAEAATRTQAMELLAVFGLAERQAAVAGGLPYGEQRKLEMVRALATKPKLLLLDEPAAGMNPQETDQLTELIGRLRREFGVSILLIEHDMSLVMKVCERIFVLDYGKEIAQGVPSAIQSNQQVIKAYLGEA